MIKFFIPFTFLFTLLFFQAGANQIKVCPTCLQREVTSAIEEANPGDTVYVKKGTYEVANFKIEKSIFLIGEEGAVIDGKGEGYIFQIFSDNVSISGFKFVNSGRSFIKDFSMIYVFRSQFFVIENNILEDPVFAFLVEKSKNGLIKNNLIYGITISEVASGNGIHLWDCSNITIEGNEVFKMRDGIYLEFVDNSIIRNNYTHENIRYGLHFMFSNHDRYESNIFKNNGAGVAVMFSKFIIMKGNKFMKNWGTASYGLLLKEIYDAEVVDNEFNQNTIGIFLEGTTRINYMKNNFIRNGWAVKVSGGCYTNDFKMNNFKSNAFDVSYNSKVNDNSFHGNYWSAYTGYDLNKDQIGDVPYRPVKLFSYVVNRTPETIVLLRSLFVDMINFSEKVSPIFTPDKIIDHLPSMKAF